MVKKIDGITSSPSSSVKETSATSTSGVKAVNSVNAADADSSVKRVRKATRPMTAEERATLFRLLNEEADKMLEQEKLSPETKETVKIAVRMAIDASILDEPDK
ncbi:MAG: hypothetical protein IT292_06925 [Deltaproteobacteria bacterium]|nr:hypothetical protein [Deltaproteobacteria bacterium]